MLGLSLKKTQATLHFDPFCSLFRFNQAIIIPRLSDPDSAFELNPRDQIIFTGSGIKIYKDFGIRDLRPKCGISREKIYLITTLYDRKVKNDLNSLLERSKTNKVLSSMQRTIPLHAIRIMNIALFTLDDVTLRCFCTFVFVHPPVPHKR